MRAWRRGLLVLVSNRKSLTTVCCRTSGIRPALGTPCIMEKEQRMRLLPTGRLTLCLCALAAPLVLGACKKKIAPAVTGPTPVQPATNGPSTGPGASDRDAADRAAREAAERERRLTAARNTLLETVFFEYDQAGLTDAGRTALESKLAILQANPGLRLRVAGHCDERGSDEYNDSSSSASVGSVRRSLAVRKIRGRVIVGPSSRSSLVARA
jgi:peptidoglycan-associated lipoprotein